MRQKKPPRIVLVLRKQNMTPNMLRITFGGKHLQGFPTGQESANIKLLMPNPGQSQKSWMESLAGSGAKPLKRTYTIVEYREHSNELDVDFALHEQPGPATSWAMIAKAGDPMAIAGPGQLRPVNTNAERFLLAGDMAALPAISAVLKTLPATARGHVLLEILNDADKQTLQAPPEVVVEWIVNPHPHHAPSNADEQPLVNAFRKLAWTEDSLSVWVAGESNSIRAIRRYLALERTVPKNDRYCSGYWQRGYTEDTHQSVKRQEPDI